MDTEDMLARVEGLLENRECERRVVEMGYVFRFDWGFSCREDEVCDQVAHD